MRCRRCGSNISFENELCPGCGRSLVQLRADNEIEFDDNKEIEVEQIKDNTPQDASVNEIQEEKVSEDVFGDAINESRVNVTSPVSNDTVRLDGLKDVFDKESEIQEEKKPKSGIIIVALTIILLGLIAYIYLNYGIDAFTKF